MRSKASMDLVRSAVLRTSEENQPFPSMWSSMLSFSSGFSKRNWFAAVTRSSSLKMSSPSALFNAWRPHRALCCG